MTLFLNLYYSTILQKVQEAISVLLCSCQFEFILNIIAYVVNMMFQENQCIHQDRCKLLCDESLYNLHLVHKHEVLHKG